MTLSKLDNQELMKAKTYISKLLNLPIGNININPKGSFNIDNLKPNDAERFLAVLKNDISILHVYEYPSGKYDFSNPLATKQLIDIVGELNITTFRDASKSTIESLNELNALDGK